MSGAKTGYQQFTTGWSEATQYAQQNHISRNVWYPVYQQDSRRLIQYGYPMSQGDRINAIRSAAGLPPTQLPSDNPNPLNLPGNIGHNAQSLLSGFDPPSMIKNFFDSITNAVHHPMGEVVRPAEDIYKLFADSFDPAKRDAAMTDFTNTVLGQHSIISLGVPGAYDVAEAFRGKEGFKYLADNPLTTVMDAIPLGRIPMEILGRTARGAALADRIGVTTDQLAKMSPGQLAMRRASISPRVPIPLKRAVTITKATGEKIKATPRAVGGKLKDSGEREGPRAEMVRITAGQVSRMFLQQIGAGKDAQDIQRELAVLGKTGEDMWAEKGQPFNDAWNKLSPEQKKPVVSYLANGYHVTDLATDTDIIAGLSPHTKDFSENQLAAVRATLDMAREYQNLLINAGTLVRVPTRLPNPEHVPGDDKPETIETTELYLADETSRAKTIIDAKETRDATAAELEAASGEFRELASITSDMTAIVFQNLQQFMRLTSTLYDGIKASLPQLSDSPRADQLRGILPSDQRFDRFNNKNAQNVANILGIEPTQREVVNRGRTQVEPFSGNRGQWSDTEIEAYDGAWRQEEHTSELDPRSAQFRQDVRKQAHNRLQLLDQLHTITEHPPLHKKTMDILSELFRPGGYVQQMKDAFEEERWKDFDGLTKLIDEKLNLKSLSDPQASEIWSKWRGQMKEIRKYAALRSKFTNRMYELWDGTKPTGKLAAKGKRAGSIKKLTIALHNANDKFLQESIRHPPAMWDRYEALETNRLIMEHEEGQRRAEDNIAKLRARGITAAQEARFRQNPTALNEMARIEAMASEANEMLSGADRAEAATIAQEVGEVLGRARALGHEPLYLSTMKTSDAERNWGSMGISAEKISRQQASFERNHQFNSGTIYDFQTGYNKALAEYYRNYLENYFQEETMPKFLLPRADLVRMAHTYFADEMLEKVGPNGVMDVAKFDEMILDRFGLRAYDPKTIFSVTHPSVVGKDMYISKDVAQALQKRWHDDDMVGKVFDKSTGLFRSAILHWSPRFTLHVVVGGAVMLMGVSDPLKLVDSLANAWRFAKTGQLPDEVKAAVTRKPDDAYLTAQIRRSATPQEGGTAATILEHTMGISAGQFAMHENIDRSFGKQQLHHVHQALTLWPRANVRLTRFAYNLYHAAAFFEGFSKAEKQRYYMQEYYDEQTHEFKYQRREMTGDQRFHEAIEHAARAMGDVLAMTPIERNFLTRAFPFWSWTRHVLSYVARFPVDHPYRAMLFSQLSRIGLADQNPNLPARTQLLFFLGSPDKMGNIHAMDMRYANPLRDTANYLSISGWLEGLNPVFTMLPNAIDPNLIFGSNVLYPNITYDSIYGTKDAAPTGTQKGFSVAENFVPQLTGIDQALNLSGTYNYLKGSNSSAFITKVLSSFGADAVFPQSINLRQVAATNEIDRYNQAKLAARNAWQTGDFSGLAGYGEVPDPRYGNNPLLNIPVPALQSLWTREAAYLAQRGLAQQGATPTNYFPQLSNPRL